MVVYLGWMKRVYLSALPPCSRGSGCVLHPVLLGSSAFSVASHVPTAARWTAMAGSGLSARAAASHSPAGDALRHRGEASTHELSPPRERAAPGARRTSARPSALARGAAQMGIQHASALRAPYRSELDRCGLASRSCVQQGVYQAIRYSRRRVGPALNRNVRCHKTAQAPWRGREIDAQLAAACAGASSAVSPSPYFCNRCRSDR